MHELFQIFTLYDFDLSRGIRLSLYYLRVIFYLALDCIFVYNYSIVQRVFLGVASGVVLVFFNVIIAGTLTLKNKGF